MPTLKRVLVSLGITAILFAGFVPFADAHETEQPYLYTFVGEQTIDGRLELAIGDVAETLDIDLGGDDVAIEATLRANADAIRSYSAQHLSIAPTAPTGRSTSAELTCSVRRPASSPSLLCNMRSRSPAARSPLSWRSRSIRSSTRSPAVMGSC